MIVAEGAGSGKFADFAEGIQCIVAVVAGLGSFAAVPDLDIPCIEVGADLHRSQWVGDHCSQAVVCCLVAAGLAGVKTVHIEERWDGRCCPLPGKNLMSNTLSFARDQGNGCKAGVEGD